jgi:RHS repeat-associated protein
MGWRLTGTAKVRRRIEEGLPRFDDSDTFELVGLGIPSELLLVDGFYRPRLEDGAFVRVSRAKDRGRWEARTKAGITFRFGGEGFTESEGKNVSAYLLREQVDRHGHRVSYEWDTAEGYGILTRVIWNDFDDASRNEVVIAYEKRPDPHRGFATGIAQSMTKRLQRIDVRHGGRLVRRYALAYSESLHPALASVTLIGNDGKSAMPRARFEYTAANLEEAFNQLVTMEAPPGQSPDSPDAALADMDGDGLTDLLLGEAGHYRTYRNHDGTRWLPAEDWIASDSPTVSLGATGVQLADMDADGAADLVVKSGTDALRYLPSPSGTQFGTPISMAPVPSFSFEDPDVRIADLDGDRRMDAIVTTPGGVAIGYNRGGSSWSEPAIVGPVDAAQPVRFSDGRTHLCDVNGDRVSDLCSLRSGGMTYWLGRGRGHFESGARATGVPEFLATLPYRLEDLNGDGWVDLVRVDVHQVSYALAVQEGEFGTVRTIEGTPEHGPKTSVHFADMNGSGTTDILWVSVKADAPASWKYLELFPDGRAGLLRRIDNGLGKIQTVDYEPAALAAARARDAKKPWKTRMNIGMPVVRRVTVSTSLGDPELVTEYAYRDGAYDPRERTFAAFAGGTQTELGGEWTPALITDSTFDTGLEHRVLRGALLTQEKRTAKGAVLLRTEVGHTVKTLASDRIEYAYKASERIDHIEGRSASEARRTLTEFVADDLGNVVEERRWGEVRGQDFLAGDDEAFVTRTFANNLDDWLLGYPATEELTNAAGVRVEFSRRYYDGAAFKGLPLGELTRGDVTREEAWVGPEPEDFELVLATTYNRDGQPIETRDARGGGHAYEWAADRTSIRAERTRTGESSELVEIAEVDGATGNLLSVVESSGQISRFEYDPFGRLTTVIRPGNTVEAPTTRYTYIVQAPLSRVRTEARVADGDLEITETLIDGLGRTRGTLAQDGDRWVLAGVSLYDARGNARRTLLPRFVDDAARAEPPLLDGAPRGTDTWRDALEREVRTRSTSGIESRTRYLPFVTEHLDGGQNDTHSPYEHAPVVTRKDGQGRVVEHGQTLDGKPLAARYVHDAAGNLVSRTDPEGAVARYDYDGRGRRIRVRDPDAGKHRFLFDATGNLTGHVYPDGVTARFTFDLAGRALTEDEDGDGEPDVTRTWDVDPERPDNDLARGKLTSILNAHTEIRHQYDERGRTTVTTVRIGDAFYSSRSEFDDQDRETVHHYPDGSSIHLARNPRGQIARYGDALEIDYGEDGLETERRFNTGVIVRTDYDDDRRRTDLQITTRSSAILEHLHWTYDSAGNLARVEDRRRNVLPENDRSERYTHDNLYRLTSVEGTWGSTAWTYSPSGNLLERRSTLPDQTIGPIQYRAERPHAPTRLDDRDFVYDARGRMTTDGERTFTWNDADELLAVTDGKATVENTFDGDGTRRVRVEHAPGGHTTVTHFLDPWSEVRDGKLVRYIVHGGQRIVRLAATNGATAAVAAGFLVTLGASAGKLALGVASTLIAVLLLIALATRLSRRRLVWTLAFATVTATALIACGGGDSQRRAPVEPERGTVQRLTDADTLLTTDLTGSLLGEATGTGNSTGRFAAYPYGVTRFDNSGETNKYAASPRDSAVGLDSMGARFYAPDLGIWTSPDPLAVTTPERLVTEDFGAANPYAYAKNSPLLAADRDGHFWHIAVGAAIGGLMGGALEAGRQYIADGRVSDWGRVGAAAGGGALSGAIVAANPAVGVTAVMGQGAVSGGAAGVATRLIESGGRDAGSLKDLVVDAGVGAATAGVIKGGAALAKAAVKKAPAVARGIAQRVKGGSGGTVCPCFAAGTAVATPEGLVAIDQIQPGDAVLTRDAVTGENTVRPVTRVYVTPQKETLELGFGAETIVATPGHPFWVEGSGWVEAADLVIGQTVQTAEGRLATLSAALSREGRETVYNLEVEGTHTYFVGETKAWVHNACGCGEAAKPETRVVAGATVTPKGSPAMTGNVDVGPTIDRIRSGGSFPHKNDGSIFQNREGMLPTRPSGHYREYVHPTPGVSGPGPQRVVTGAGGEMFYSPDHYKSFVPLN